MLIWKNILLFIFKNPKRRVIKVKNNNNNVEHERITVYNKVSVILLKENMVFDS